MLRVPWICHSCHRALLNPTRFPKPKLARFVSTAEHNELQKTLNDSFDAVKAKRAGELRRVATALEDWETANSAIAELRSMTQEPADQDDADLAAIARDELDAEVAKLQGLERNLSASLTPRHPFADLPCMLEIRPGPGGLEGRYFADTVFKMYRGLCARKGYRNKVVKYDLAEGAGDHSSAEGELPLQEAILEIEDAGAYDTFRAEAGMHRVQRIPSTESKGRVHTSAVAVWVLPSFAEAAADDAVDFENPESDFYIDPQEVKIETMRARGAGGQHVNKTESAIRMTHLPTGTTVSMQDHRSQHRNRDEAWKLMRSRIAAQRAEKREEEAARLRNSVLSTTQITRGDKIRTYNYNQDRCTDHRAGLDVHNLPSVLEGSDVLDKIMDAARESLVGKEIEMLVAEEEAKAKAAASGGKK
ncbi:putative peptide chain release factor 1, mitochondrial [Beauveria bassiana]|nr:putative peptide chain release factor 1, mitochondrial [Beauveria bassiana]